MELKDFYQKTASKILKKKFFLKEKKAITDPQTLWLKTSLKDFVFDVLKSKEFKEYEILNTKMFILLITYEQLVCPIL